MTDERYRVQSLGWVLDIFEWITACGEEGARLTDLAQDVGLSKAGVRAILLTHKARGIFANVGEGMSRRCPLG